MRGSVTTSRSSSLKTQLDGLSILTVIIFQAHGLRVVIYLDDHEPAHVPVFGDGHAKINLIGPGDGPELVWVEGMKRAEVRQAVRLVAERRDDFLARWREVHG